MVGAVRAAGAVGGQRGLARAIRRRKWGGHGACVYEVRVSHDPGTDRVQGAPGYTREPGTSESYLIMAVREPQPQLRVNIIMKSHFYRTPEITDLAGSGRPRGPQKPFQKAGCEAPHLLEGFSGAPGGRQDPQNR